EHKTLAIILSILFTLMIIIVFSSSHIGNSTSLGRNIEKIVSMTQNPVSSAGNGVKSGIYGILQFRSILNENEQLKEKISELNREIIQLQLEEAELEELRSLSDILGYENLSTNYTFVTADVIGMDGSNWFNLFTINAGTEDGIYKDAVVLNGDGLIGRVLETGADWSKIISVIDESNSVSFKVFRDMNLLGILYGDGKGSLEGYMIDPDAAIIEGDILITSGIGMYPEGVPIGKVKDVIWNNDTLLKTVTIEPSAYFKNLQKVTLLVKK
ncbi:MAG: rod shape-determining protein MreC, partial [Clostridia bacterium]|nr:rod shape-determining protein MreC [Clostridia bacterium]